MPSRNRLAVKFVTINFFLRLILWMVSPPKKLMHFLTYPVNYLRPRL